VVIDWREVMMGLPQRTMRPSIPRVSEQLDPRFAASRRTTAPVIGLPPLSDRANIELARRAMVITN